MNNLRSFVPRQLPHSRGNFPDLSCGHAALHIFAGDINFASGWLSREKFRLDGRAILHARWTSSVLSSTTTIARVVKFLSGRRCESTWWRNFSGIAERGKLRRSVKIFASRKKGMIRIGEASLCLRGACSRYARNDIAKLRWGEANCGTRLLTIFKDPTECKKEKKEE